MANDVGGETTFSISGGVGSVSYELAEIAEAGPGIALLAGRIDPLLDRLQSEAWWLSGAAQGAALYPYAPLDAIQHAMWTARQAQAHMLGLAQRVFQASENYAETEARTAAATAQAGRLEAFGKGLDAWAWGALSGLKILADVAGWLKRVQDQGLRDSAEDVLNRSAAYGAGVMGPSVGMVYLMSQLRSHKAAGAGVQPVAAVRKLLDMAGMSRPGHLAIRPVPGEEWDTAARQWPKGHAVADPAVGAPWAGQANIAAMLAGTKDAYGYPPGSIGVVKYDRPDGSPLWVVHLPGTEDWSRIDSSNPFDMEGNVEGLTSAHRDMYRQQHVLVQDFIKQALKASGALPTDDVLLTGHSGGGIHAAAAAADPEFREQVNVQMIIIAGSPGRNQEMPDDVSVIDLENEHDIVPALDLGAPPAARNWVTVTSHRPPPAGTGLGTIVAQAHALEYYLKDAAALDQSAEPAVLASRDRLRTLMGAGVGVGAGGVAVVGTKWVYQGRDVPDKIKPKPTEGETGVVRQGPYKPGPR